MSQRSLFDISPPLSPRTAVWPGDQPLTRTVLCALEAGSNIDLSTLTTTVHIGAHADAPSHYRAGGLAIDAVDLDPYLGPCYVTTCTSRPLVLPEDCKKALETGATRILFRTLSQPDSTHFNTDFTAFAPAAVTLMGRSGVKLIGIDTPSVDPFDSKELTAHKEFLQWGIRNLEGLALQEVPDGPYELIALPLKLVGFDASPVRAILRSLL